MSTDKNKVQNRKGAVKVVLRSFDSASMASAIREILYVAKKIGAKVYGPIPLPVKCRKFTVIKGPHVDKRSREQFEMRILKRFCIIKPLPGTSQVLADTVISCGVDVTMHILG